MLRLLAVAAVSLASFFGFVAMFSGFVGSDGASVIAAMVLALVGVPALLLHLWKPVNASSKCPGGQGLYPECLYVVSVSPTEIRVTHPTRPVETLALEQLAEVDLITNDSGPFGSDIWWLLLGRAENTGCSFPCGASGEKAVLELVQALPGFNNEVFIQAMGSTSNARFTCWRAST
jgi:hypothetical protein